MINYENSNKNSNKDINIINTDSNKIYNENFEEESFDKSNNQKDIIDIERINKKIRKKFNLDYELKKKYSETQNDNNEIFNDDEGIQKSPLCEIDPITKEFECTFPNFYQVDYLDPIFYSTLNQKNKKYILDEIENNNSINNENSNDENNENVINDISIHSSFFEEIEKNIDYNILLNLLISKDISKINNRNSFSLDTLLYVHKDSVYVGKIRDINYFIKKVVIKNSFQLNLIIDELNILFKLLYNRDPNNQNNPYINKLYYYFFENKELYLFYEYEPISLLKGIYQIENDNNNKDEEINKNKLFIVNKLLRFVVMLHSNNILHRDIKLEYFFLTQPKNNQNDFKTCYVKTFDFVNAFMFNDSIEINKIDEDFMKQMREKLFLTPRFVSPELTLLKPAFGWGEDIWSLACLFIEIFIKYTDFQEEMISRLINRIFRGDEYLKETVNEAEKNLNSLKENENGSLNNNNDNNSLKNNENNNNNNQINNQNQNKNNDQEIKYVIPKIPKSIPLEIAQIIAICFYVEPRNRPNIITLVDKFNNLFKKFNINQYEISVLEREKVNFLLEICRYIYLFSYNERTNMVSNRWKECPYHTNSVKNFYCETCKNFFCENSIIMAHKNHLYELIYGQSKNSDGQIIDIEEFSMEKKILKGFQVDLEKLEMEKNFKIIEEFSQDFDNDYYEEEQRINKEYDMILKKINELEKNQLHNLDSNKEKFQKANQKLFFGSKNIEEYCNNLYTTKGLFFSYLNRFNSSLKNNEINSENYLNFRSKIDKFLNRADNLILNGNNLKKKCEDLFQPGKYIFRHEQYTEEISKYLKILESKIFLEKMKFFDYSDSDTLFLTKELIMIIPLTNYVFSYSRNSYKKFSVNFEKNNIKLNSFLPGCSTLHLNNNFYITGGEIKDEATSNFLVMNIEDKVIYEKIEMNYPRRFHTMISIKIKAQNFIMVVGGWDCNEVEYINTEEMSKWVSLPRMKFKRSDPTLYFFNNKYVYVFGGWDYSQKKCIGDVERYQIVNNELDEEICVNNSWENVKIKGESISLQKYNMGIINLIDEKTENSEKIILVGGFDESYDYSQSVIKIEIMQKENSIFVNKDIKGLPTGGESSFWYEKEFHIMNNDLDGELIAVNFNCFNNVYVYTFRTCEFKQYANSTSKN